MYGSIGGMALFIAQTESQAQSERQMQSPEEGHCN